MKFFNIKNNMKLEGNEEQFTVVKHGFPRNLSQEVHEASRLISVGDIQPHTGDFGKVYIMGEIIHRDIPWPKDERNQHPE